MVVLVFVLVVVVVVVMVLHTTVYLLCRHGHVVTGCWITILIIL